MFRISSMSLPPQIHRLDRRVSAYFRGRSFGEDSAVAEHSDIMRNIHDNAHIMLD